MAKVTREQQRKLNKLRDKLDMAILAVFKSVESHHVPFNECYTQASEEVQKAYVKARTSLDDYQRQLVAEGRAYWSGTYFVENK